MDTKPFLKNNTTKPKKLSAIIFDVDGVLFETEPLHIKAWQTVLGEYGIEVYEKSLHRWVGEPCHHMARYYTGILQGTLPPGEGELLAAGRRPETIYSDAAELEKELYRRKEEILTGIAEDQLRTPPGLEEYLQYFSIRTVLAYVTSNNRSMIERFFSITGIGTYFSHGITVNDVSRTKPSPEPYLTVLRLLGIGAEEGIVLEDSPSGIRSAKAAGLYCLGIANTLDRKVLTEADIIFSGAAEACSWIRDNINIEERLI